MSQEFFERPILNSPYDYPGRHWKLETDGQPLNRIEPSRRRSKLTTPIPNPKKRRREPDQPSLPTVAQEYDPTPIINEIRTYVDGWRNLRNPSDWLVTPDTARLLQHWRDHPFQGIRPFFCQREAVETIIWLIEVAPKRGKRVEHFWAYIKTANAQANPELLRLALKLATGGPARRRSWRC